LQSVTAQLLQAGAKFKWSISMNSLMPGLSAQSKILLALCSVKEFNLLVLLPLAPCIHHQQMFWQV
jgi:hypothetical protein